jgi:hypothetical protein
MPGDKTHDLQVRTFERKDGLPKARDRDANIGSGRVPEENRAASGPAGTNRESRDHHKHNNPGQSGHKPQRHGVAEQKP